MAQYKTDEVVRGLETAFESDTFTVRITKNSKGKSSAGNPMLTTEIEIVDPPTAKAVGSTARVALAGQKVRLFGMLNPGESWGLAKLITGLKTAGLAPQEVMGLPKDVEFDDDAQLLNNYVGKTFRMILQCEARPLMSTLTPEQKAAGEKPVQLKDQAGKPLTNGYQIKADWQQVVGPAGVEAGPNQNWA